MTGYGILTGSNEDLMSILGINDVETHSQRRCRQIFGLTPEEVHLQAPSQIGWTLLVVMVGPCG